MNIEAATQLKNKALATFLRTDGIQADEAEIVDFSDWKKYPDALRYAGNYVILRTAGEVVAIYKQTANLGSARPDGSGGFVVSSISFGVKRVKRAPKGLIAE